MKNPVACSFKDEGGQGMVEYGLIIALVAVVAIVGLVLLGPQIQKLFKSISSQLPAAS